MRKTPSLWRIPESNLSPNLLLSIGGIERFDLRYIVGNVLRLIFRFKTNLYQS